MEPMKYKHAVVGSNFHLQFTPNTGATSSWMKQSSLNAKGFSMRYQIAVLKLLSVYQRMQEL